jgi:hypothetical protein
MRENTSMQWFCNVSEMTEAGASFMNSPDMLLEHCTITSEFFYRFWNSRRDEHLSNESRYGHLTIGMIQIKFSDVRQTRLPVNIREHWGTIRHWFARCFCCLPPSTLHQDGLVLMVALQADVTPKWNAWGVWGCWLSFLHWRGQDLDPPIWSWKVTLCNHLDLHWWHSHHESEKAKKLWKEDLVDWC